MFQETKLPDDVSPNEIILPKQLNSIPEVEKALESGSTIQVKNPITLSYFDIQRLTYLQKESSAKVQVKLPYRADTEVQGLRQKIEKAGGNIASITVHSSLQYSDNVNQNAGHVLDLIDLVLYLSGGNAGSVQGFSNESTTDAANPKFTQLAGSLVSGGVYSIQITNQANMKSVTLVQVILSTGEVLTLSTTSQSESAEGNGTLDDAAKALRIYVCAIYSIINSRKVTIKHVSDKVIAARSIGTAFFNRAGLFNPALVNSGIAVTGLYSAKADKVREIYNEWAQKGEPFEYFPSSEVSLANQYTSYNWRPIIYIPSLPGTRKDQEMADALKSGYVVLAEKPAFANAELAKQFYSALDKEHQKRLFFGWHYQHHYVNRKVFEVVKNGTYGKVKHVRTYFSVPKLLDEGRIFDTAQGGAGVDIHCYNLHITLRLIGFNHECEIVESKIQSAQELDPFNPVLSKIDFKLDTKLKFSNGTTADLHSTFDLNTILHTEAEIFFEDGTKILVKEFCHPPMISAERFEPVLIFKAGGTRWENFMTQEDLKNPEYWKTTYDRQLAFIRKQATGEGDYDVVNNDTDGLGMETNIKLHEIIDGIFTKGGFALKPGC